VKIKRGSTSVRRLIFIGDTSKTDGSGLANLVYNSSGLVAYYFAGDLSNDVQITLATATLGTWTSGGFIAVDNTTMPGWYEIGIPDAALDGGNEIAIQLRGATNMAPVNVYISLDAVDYQDAAGFGLSRFDAAISSRMATYTQPTGFLAATFPATVSSYAGGAVASVTGAVGSVTARVTANTDQWGGVAVTGMPLPTTSYTTPPTVAQVVTGVYAALPADHTVSGSYGVRLILALNSYRELQLTASYHAASVVHAFQPDVIDSTALATSAVTEIQTGLATLANQTTIIGYLDTEVAAIKVVTDKLNTGLVADGAVWQYTANMLELAPAGGGGAGDASQATLLEVQDTVEAIAASLSGVPITTTGRIADGGTITLYCGDDLRVRSGTQLTVQISDVGGAIYDRLSAAGVDLAWGASRRGLPASAISGTIASLTEVGSGAAQSLAIVIEIGDGGASLQPAEDYTWQIESERQHSTEVDQLVEVEGSLVLRRRVV